MVTSQRPRRIYPAVNLLSGFLFPFRGMPEWAQWLGTILPVTHLLRIVRGAMLKGVGISEALLRLWALALFVVIVPSLAVKPHRNARLSRRAQRSPARSTFRDLLP